MTETDAAAGRRTALAPGTRVLLTLAAAVIVLAGVWLARDILAPLLVAAVLVVVVHPVRRPLERRGWPRWLATAAVAAIASLLLATMMGLIVFAAGRFAAILPAYETELAAAGEQLAGWLSALGFHPAAAVSVVDPVVLLEAAAGVANTVLGWGVAFFFVLAYVLFMAADGGRYAEAGRLFGADRAGTLERIRRFTAGTRRFFVVNTVFGVIVAVLDGLVLWALGVPAPIVWAILAFVTNFIPNIGFVIGLVPPALLALVVGGWPLLLLVVLAYCVINATLQELVQPRFVAETVNLSFTLTFFSVVFWTFVIGPIGAILAVPLTLFLRAFLLEGDPESAWLRWLSGDRGASRRVPIDREHR